MWDQREEWHTPYSKVCSYLLFITTTRFPGLLHALGQSADSHQDGLCRRHTVPCRCQLDKNITVSYLSTIVSLPGRQDLLLRAEYICIAVHRCMHLLDALPVSNAHSDQRIRRAKCLRCKPIRGYWDASVAFTCIDMRSTLMTMAALNSLSDFLVYL